jgi:hypothetical protein
MQYRVSYCDKEILDNFGKIDAIYSVCVEAENPVEAARKAKKELGRGVFILNSENYAV